MNEPTTPMPRTGRTWAITLQPGTQLLNANQRLHYHTQAARTAWLREQTGWLARQQQIPPISRARIVCELLPPDNRRRDPANWAPTAKAMTDGLVDAGVLPDDDHTHLAGPYMELTPPAQRARRRTLTVKLHIHELAEPAPA